MKVILFLLFLPMNFIWCAAADRSAGQGTIPLRVWFWYLPDTLDTYKANQFSLQPLAKNIYATLVSSYLDGTVQGMAAESWTVSADGLVWRFRPRRGISFQDGTPITAAAIVASFRRILWLTRGDRLELNALLPELGRWKNYTDPLKTLYAENGEVVFVFGKRPRNLFEAIEHPIYGIANPECFAGNGEWRSPFCAGGSGEYEVSRTTPHKITITARHMYKSLEKAPDIVELMVPTPENPSSVISMRSGNGDISVRMSLEVDSELLGMLKSAGIQHKRLPALETNYAVLNLFRSPFNDPGLRRSFRDVFLERLRSDPLFSPDAEVNASFIPKGAIGYSVIPISGVRKAVRSHAGEKVVVFLNKKSANKLGKKRVFTDIVRQAVVDSLERHGLKLEIIDPSSGEYWEKLKKGDYDMLLQSASISAENPFETLRELFLREKGGSLPTSSGKISPLIEAAASSPDPAERRRLAEKINVAIFDEAAVVAYAHSGLVYLFKPGVDLSRCSMFLPPIEFRAVNWVPAAR